MTKKILFGMSALAMLWATSCQDDLSMPQTGDQATVAFNISTPEIATRAYSDGTTATNLQYAVYDANGKHLTALDGKKTMSNLTTTVELKLTTGNSYSVIFWAAAHDAPYRFSPTDKTVTVDYTNAVSNDENRDAFFIRHDFTVKGAQSENVKLYRPFAQLNIGTNDYAASEAAGYTPTHSAVKVSNVYTTLDLWEGNVSNPTNVTVDPITFASAEINKEETFPVADYEYLAMNYLLVDEKELIDVEFSYTANSDTKTRTVGSVPVQRNYRTNIYGQLLTSDVDINVEIVPAYNEPDHEAEELYIAAACGGEVTLTEDVKLPKSLIVADDISMIINLDGHSIINQSTSLELEEGDGIIVYGDLTINGEGTVKGNTRAIWARGNYGAKVRINGGNYIGAVEGSTEVIYASGDGKIDIYGGTFEAKTEDQSSFAAPQYAVLNLHGNGKTGCDIDVYGGSFKNFNPADNISENPKHNFCAEGYNAVEKDGWYHVGKSVQNTTELKEALNNEPVVNITSAIDNGTNVTNINNNDVVINMDNKEIIAGGKGTNNYAFNVYGSDIEVNDANLNGAGFAVMEKSNLTVNSGAIAAKPGKSGRNMFYVVGNSTVIVNKGNYTFDRTSCYFVYVEAGSTCIINGGHFEKPLANNAKKDSFVNAASEGTVIIKGGTFNVDPTNWLADGYKATKSGKIWTVTEE